jgi:hypothetical protein
MIFNRESSGMSFASTVIHLVFSRYPIGSQDGFSKDTTLMLEMQPIGDAVLANPDPRSMPVTRCTQREGSSPRGRGLRGSTSPPPEPASPMAPMEQFT